MKEQKLQIYEIFELAKNYSNEKKYDFALENFNITKKDKNFYEKSLFEIIKIYFELKQYDDILLSYKDCLNKFKDSFFIDNIKIIAAKVYEIYNKTDKAISILDSIRNKKVLNLEIFHNERLGCSYSKFNDFFKVSEFSGNIEELKEEYTKIRKLVPQSKVQLFYISRISNFLHDYSFTKKIIGKYKKNFADIDLFYDNAILNEFELAGKKIILESKPRSMWIATSSKCNISCQMCFANKQNWSLSKQDVQDVYSYLPYLEHITWWGGEPTISVLFYEMLNYSLQYKNIKHTIITNGQYMPQNFLDMVSKNNIEVVVSIDSVDKDKYENIRVGASFNKLKENLSKLVAVLNNELIKINTVVMKKNFNELKNIINFAKKFNIKKITFIPLSSNSKESVNEKDLKLFDNNLQNNSNIFNSTYIVKKDLNSKQNFKSFCHIPWTDITFSYSGSLIPDNLCSYFGNKHYLLDKYNMKKYWNSEIIKNLRKKIIKDKCCSIYCPKFNMELK